MKKIIQLTVISLTLHNVALDEILFEDFIKEFAYSIVKPSAAWIIRTQSYLHARISRYHN